MNLSGYIACICEGSAEQAIMELLLENSRLIFNKSQMLEEEIIRCRDAKKFEQKYLGKGFSTKITVLRILDSRREKFKLSKAYEGKIDVINIITAPEIEMLIICKEKKYEQFKKARIRPSEYCKINLRYNDIKSYDFVRNYFSDTDELVECICEYRRLSKIPKGELTLSDLLKDI